MVGVGAFEAIGRLGGMEIAAFLAGLQHSLEFSRYFLVAYLAAGAGDGGKAGDQCGIDVANHGRTVRAQLEIGQSLRELADRHAGPHHPGERAIRMAIRARESDDPLLRNAGKHRLADDQALSRSGAMLPEKITIGIAVRQGAPGRIAPAHLTVLIADPEGFHFRHPRPGCLQQALYLCMIHPPVLGRVFKCIDNAEQGQINAPSHVRQIGIQQRSEVGCGGAHLFQ